MLVDNIYYFFFQIIFIDHINEKKSSAFDSDECLAVLCAKNGTIIQLIVTCVKLLRITATQ